MADVSTNHASVTGLSRRRFLELLAAGAAGGSGLLTACGDGSGGGGGKGTITLSSWDIPTDLKSYRSLAKEYARDNPGVKPVVQVTAAEDFYAWLSSRLAAGKAPDVLRMAYQDIGMFIDQGGLVDLTEYLPDGHLDAFLPQYAATVQQDDGIYGIPQHTDGWGLYLDTQVMDEIGVDAPVTIDAAWGWDEFLDVAREVRKVTGQHAFSWFFSGPITGWRWLPVLYMHGGALIDVESMTPTIDSTEGVEAIEWSRRWYEEGLIPDSNTIKGSQIDTAVNLFINGQVGMMVCSDFQMNAIRGKLRDERWTVGPLFKDQIATTNMGGNALVVTASADDPEGAAEFAEFVCNKENMAYFCEQSLFVPVRNELVGQTLDWTYRPDLMEIFAANAETLLPEMATLQSMPEFGSINEILSDQLDLCWTGQQSSAETATNISENVQSALKG